MTVYHAITTCSQSQWAAYGRTMAKTFARFWAREVQLTVYAEGFSGEPNGEVHFVDLGQAAPWLAPWKAERTPEQRGMTKDGYRYRWDAVRFSHKIAALSAAMDSRCDVLIWLDSDIVTHAPATVEWLDSLFPADATMAWLDRIRTYPECGFMMFRLPQAAALINAIVAMYLTGAVFKLQEWHDSFVIHQVAKGAVAQGEIKVASLSGEGRAHHHVFASSPLSCKMDHLKGGRKLIGRTPKHERYFKDNLPYWR